jgi:hypothetical protein
MREFRINRLNITEIQLWCYNNIGHGGLKLQRAIGCQGFEDQWDGDEWQLLYNFFGPSIIVKDDVKATLFALRWS